MTLNKLNALCGSCERIFDAAEYLLPREEATGSPKLIDFTDSGSRCHLCSLILYNRNRHMFSSPDNVVRHENAKLGIRRFYPGHVELSIKDNDNVYPIIFKKDYDDRGWLQSTVPSTTWSNQAIAQARAWLSTCRKTHNNCKGPLSYSRLPLRLVGTNPGVGQGKTAQRCDTDAFHQSSTCLDGNVRICYSKGLPLDTPYLTLSYRWPESPTLLLNDGTIEELLVGISAERLQDPKAATVRDAIHVTRCLGFRYLWVDALCIKQDDEAEKATEIVHMGQIYSASVLTISATAGTNGLFFDPNPLFVAPCIRYTNNQTAAAIARKGREIIAAYYCKTRKSEVFPHEVTDNWGLPEKFHHLYSLSAPELEALWYRTINNYSQTSLTFPDDRLRAVSAISREFCALQNLSPKEFCAGMWKSDLPEKLLWFELHEQDGDSSVRVKDKETEYLAPSWSWASVKCQIYFGSYDKSTTAVSVIEVRITPRSQDPFDIALDGYLRLQGPIHKVHRECHNGICWVRAEGSGIWHRDLGRHRVYNFDRSGSPTIFISWDWSRINPNAWHDDIEPTRTLYFLYVSISENGYGYGSVDGLVLERAGRQGCYVRRGTFVVCMSICERSKLPGILGGRSYALGEDEYLDVDGNENYMIDIL
ncbi:heterokaryon incompatibility protein-domain-containing protein [Hypoxylon sp. FL1857]|nr:heterokaryon incompatibility protein-domain-containing protein [Hypoxylon sp. FL1857]